MQTARHIKTMYNLCLNTFTNKQRTVYTMLYYKKTGCILLAVSLRRHVGQRCWETIVAVMHFLQNTWPHTVDIMTSLRAIICTATTTRDINVGQKHEKIKKNVKQADVKQWIEDHLGMSVHANGAADVESAGDRTTLTSAWWRRQDNRWTCDAKRRHSGCT